MAQRVTLRTSVPAFRQRTSLDGVTFDLGLAWNERESAWYLSVADADGLKLRGGIRMALNTPLLRSVVDARRPAGELYLVDLDGTGVEAGLDDLGVRVLLMYITGAESDAIAAEAEA